MPFTNAATDRRRELPKSRFWGRVFSTVSVGAVVLAPVAALALWLLVSDPVTAAAVMERGDLLPVLESLLKMIGRAITVVMNVL
ncbi:MAG: hypothetical protein Q8T13_06815 [Acidobacteriota bacterium]|nr:hypothetical protein [Acidobacteriota bacterium]